MSKSNPVQKQSVKQTAFVVERDGSGFSLYELTIENDKVQSKICIHHEDVMSITLNKLKQAIIDDHK